MLSVLRKLLSRIIGGKAKPPVAKPSAPARPIAPPQPVRAVWPDQVDLGFDDETTDEFLERMRREREQMAPRLQVDSKVPWEAKYPEFAYEDGRPVAIEGADGAYQEDNDDAPWLLAPADSHVWGMRYTTQAQTLARDLIADDDENPFRETANERLRHRSGTKFLLHVRFKPSPNGKWGVRGYTYDFNNPSEGKRVFDQMKVAAHPGEIVWSELIRKRVPYRREI